YAGRAGVNEPENTTLAARVQNVPSSERIGLVVELPRSPDSGDSRNVKNGFDLAAGSLNAFRIADVASLPVNAQFVEPRMWMARKHPHRLATGDELLGDVEAEKSRTAGHQRLHR